MISFNKKRWLVCWGKSGKNVSESSAKTLSQPAVSVANKLSKVLHMLIYFLPMLIGVFLSLKAGKDGHVMLYLEASYVGTYMAGSQTIAEAI